MALPAIVYLTAFFLGTVHALEVDHMVTVTTLVSGSYKDIVIVRSGPTVGSRARSCSHQRWCPAVVARHKNTSGFR